MSRFEQTKTFQTKEEFVFQTLREAILHANLQPGERLVVDRLAEELKVSPIPVRTALQRLEVEGLVQIVPFTGAVVTDITPAEIEEIFTVLEALERVAFESAASNPVHAQPGVLEDLLKQMDEALASENFEHWYELNRAFHLAVTGLAKMDLLQDFMVRAFDRWDRLRRLFFRQRNPVRLAASQEDHRELLSLLRAGDVTGLVAKVSAHNLNARDSYRSRMA